ncbi:MAG: aminotransferase class V-fold PLP-dependent enzyme [Planctomycetota bacterium]|nr:aminotransferase class V-fold PLP-dependent enzyme [Planctomycetota bacterium]
MEIYLDNAATSHKKPKEVIEKVMEYLKETSCNPGRSAYPLAVKAGRLLFDIREKLASFFGVDEPTRLVFTRNATEAINLFLRGFLSPGSKVLTTSMEHNAVMRTLSALSEERNVRFEKIWGDGRGVLEPAQFREALRKEKYDLVVVNHMSNVSGTLAPLEEICSLCADMGVPVLVDVAQSAGTVLVKMPSEGDVAFAFTGHKSLMAIQGVGGLIFNNDSLGKRVKPLITGGTGSLSSKEVQPDFLPDKLESGTLPMPAIVALGAAIDFINSTGLGKMENHKRRLTRSLIKGLSEIEKVTLYGTKDERQVGVVSFTLKGMTTSEAGDKLSSAGVYCRVGLHCAPSAHRTLGTYPDGTIRFSVGYFNTEEDVRLAVDEVRKIAEKR